ncbi:MAG: hypothetical protein HC767_02475 [Akkermansiaceae bacterium]|nr:hypothetical protein [Akkermansiaceae bacterium]
MSVADLAGAESLPTAIEILHRATGEIWWLSLGPIHSYPVLSDPDELYGRSGLLRFDARARE